MTDDPRRCRRRRSRAVDVDPERGRPAADLAARRRRRRRAHAQSRARCRRRLAARPRGPARALLDGATCPSSRSSPAGRALVLRKPVAIAPVAAAAAAGRPATLARRPAAGAVGPPAARARRPRPTRPAIGQGAAHRRLLRLAGAGLGAVRRGRRGGRRRPGHRPHRGDEAVQRDQVATSPGGSSGSSPESGALVKAKQPLIEVEPL